MKIDDLRLTIDDLKARRGKAARSWKNCKLYLVLCTLFWWLDAYAEEIAKAILYILLGALAAPFVLCAALGMYENAVREDEPVDAAYWIERGYDPLPEVGSKKEEVRSRELREPEARQAS